jgi:membrane-anchored protein YejM (alkaline phosphatase superfamily)
MVMTEGNLRISSSAYSSGFLPAVYQGTLVRTEGAAIQNLAPPPQISRSDQRVMLDQINRWNRQHQETRADDSRLEARIANYELAFRMQTAAPELMDISQEPPHVRELYGIDKEPTSKFGRMCLLARRMVEHGVRFVQLYSSDWDGHGDCQGNHQSNASRCDQPMAGLLADLKQRGLFDSTLVVWTGEFGRTPVMQGNRGRDHNPYGFSSWFAGGGVRGGKVIGATDDFGFRAVEDKVHVNDLHATMLTLLGLEHERLTYLFEGRERRLTDVGGANNLANRLSRG